MSNHLDPPLVPRNGHTLNVLAICRISTDHQDQKSLADQEALYRRFVRKHYDGPVRWTGIAGRGSGEYLDREELVRAEELIKSRTFDLVIAEDLARICRRIKAYQICKTAKDCGTRLFAIRAFRASLLFRPAWPSSRKASANAFCRG
jgi:DNA invertase Pin-like site-specific DNA recombinase